MLSYAGTFLKSQLLTSIPYPTADLTGQTIIVTGSNSGLGLEAARHIVRLGATKVILAVRTVFKGDAAASQIIESCSAKKSVIEVWQLDMGSKDSIRAFAKRAEQLERLDAAILNAGILTSNFELVNGNESHLAVNVIGTMLLSSLLLPTLKQSADRTGQRGRLTVNGSDLMYIAKIDELETDSSIVGKLNDPNQTNMSKRYSVSKQLVFYGIQELARQNPLSETSNVLITVLTPGACQSELFRDDVGLGMRIGLKVSNALIARTTEVGSRTLVHGIIPELPADAHGRFLMNCAVAPSGINVDGEQGLRLAKKWNLELFELLKQ